MCAEGQIVFYFVHLSFGTCWYQIRFVCEYAYNLRVMLPGKRSKIWNIWKFKNETWKIHTKLWYIHLWHYEYPELAYLGKEDLGKVHVRSLFYIRNEHFLPDFSLAYTSISKANIRHHLLWHTCILYHYHHFSHWHTHKSSSFDSATKKRNMLNRKQYGHCLYFITFPMTRN